MINLIELKLSATKLAVLIVLRLKTGRRLRCIIANKFLNVEKQIEVGKVVKDGPLLSTSALRIVSDGK